MAHDDGADDLLADLRDGLGPGAVVTDPDVVDGHRRDHTGLLSAGRPVCAVLPATTAEVQHVIRTAVLHDVPVVTRGAGSGLAGAANALDGAVTLLTTRMDRILDVDTDDLLARVQPGVLNGDLSRAVAERGLWYPPDPASADFSTIGGNVATNAGGLCCVKYGVTRDYVLGLEVVLADGRAVRLGRRTVKGVAGYDLVGLFVGSEGTLGVVTEVTVRLRPAPEPGGTLVATFGSLAAAGDAVAAITRTTTPSLLEILDRATLRAVERHRPMGLETDQAALLLVRCDGDAATTDGDLDRVRAACEAAGATYAAATTDPDEAEALLTARRLALPALEALGQVLLDDVVVPRSRLTELIGRVERIAEDHAVTIGTFGHAGDGNLHPTLVVAPESEPRVRAAFDAIVTAALDLGGTVTGEHGVGRLKRDHLRDEVGDDVLELQQRIRSALDPDGRLNPGALWP